MKKQPRCPIDDNRRVFVTKVFEISGSGFDYERELRRCATEHEHEHEHEKEGLSPERRRSSEQGQMRLRNGR